MLKLMLVDDEKHVLTALKKIIDMEALDYEICYEATDGFTAFEMAGILCPDVVITDISMPDFNGLMLAKKIKEICQKTKIVMLTGHENFYYAREAIGIGVSEYLLKPINTSEFTALMKKLKAQIEEEEKSGIYIETLKQKADISEKIIKERFMNWLLSGKQVLSGEEIAQRLDFYKIPLMKGAFTVIAIEFDKKEGFIENETVNANTESLIRIANEIFHQFKNRYIFGGKDDNVILIIGNETKSEDAIKNLSISCEEMKLYILDIFKSSISIGIGSKYYGFENIYKSFYEAIYALKYKFLMGYNNIIIYDSIHMSKIKNDYNADKKRNEILLNMRNRNNDGIRKLINSIFDELIKMNLNLEYIQTICLDMIFTGLLFADENRISIQDVFGTHFDMIEEMKTRKGLNEVKNWIMDYYCRLVEFSNQIKLPNSNRLVEMAKRIIENGIANPELSVKTIAEEIHINKNYLSQLFKKEFRMPLVKYINKYRMEKAKEYMDKGWLNIGEISTKVGFDNQFYFSTSFKEFFGVSPSKYVSYKYK